MNVAMPYSGLLLFHDRICEAVLWRRARQLLNCLVAIFFCGICFKGSVFIVFANDTRLNYYLAIEIYYLVIKLANS